MLCALLDHLVQDWYQQAVHQAHIERIQLYKNQLTTIDEISVSVAVLRDLVQTLNIQNEAQKLQELKTILDGVVRKNRLLPGAVGVSDRE